MKKMMCLVLIILLLSNQFVLGDTIIYFNDVRGHWAENVIMSWASRGMILGYPDGTFRPENAITRAEFVTLINNVYGYAYKETPNYFDVQKEEWFYETVLIGKSNGYLEWYDANVFYGNQAITREEVAAIISHVINLEAEDVMNLLVFKDTSTVTSLSKLYLAALVENGYMSGYPDKTIRIGNKITRAEALVMINKILGEYITSSGVIGDVNNQTVVERNLTINSKNTTLVNYRVKSDLVIAAGVLEGDIILENVVVEGRTLINGGGASSVVIRNSYLKDVYVMKRGNDIRIVNDLSNIESLEHFSSGKVEGDFGESIITLLGPNQTIIIDGDFGEVVLNAPGIELEVDKTSTIKKMVMNEKSRVFGDGKILLGEINHMDAIMDSQPVELVYGEGIIIDLPEEEIPAGAYRPPPVVSSPVVIPSVNKAPFNIGQPKVTGIHQVGQILVANRGSWVDDSTPNLSVRYYWELSHVAGSVNVVVKPQGDYTIKLEDLNHFIRLVVIASDGTLETVATTGWVKITNVPNRKPRNVSLPSVEGVYRINQNLIADKGEWIDDYTKEITLTYIWELSDSNTIIHNANILNSYLSGNHTLVEADVGLYIRIKVIADDGELIEVAHSMWEEVGTDTNAEPINNDPPLVLGNHQVDQTLIADMGSWSDDFTDPLGYSYIWQVSNHGRDTVIKTYPEGNHTLKSDDAGKDIRIKVATDDDEFTVDAYSEWIEVIDIINTAPKITRNPNVIGDFEIDKILVADEGEWVDDEDDFIEIEYRWEISKTPNENNVVNIGSGDYEIQDSDALRYIRLVVIATDDASTPLSTTFRTTWYQVQHHETNDRSLGYSIPYGRQ